jgi:kynurenine aminotransferase
LKHRYISNIEMAGGTCRYLPLQPPKYGASKTSSAADWTINMAELENLINPKTRMIVRLNPHNEQVHFTK